VTQSRKRQKLDMPLNSTSEQPGTPRWLHYCAVATVFAALPLLLLGAEVTTKKVGMVDKKGFRAPWHLFVVLAEKLQNNEPIDMALVLEHSHRLAGFLVGTLAIVLAVGLWFRDKRAWVCWLGTAALVGVIAQGLLGIFRVNLNAVMGRDLALIHGCFAQLVFALLVSLVLFTSRRWSMPLEPPASPHDAVRLWRWSVATTALVYLQIVFGAVVRHRDVPFGARLHLLVAFGVVAAVVWLIKLVLDCQPRLRGLTVSAVALAGLVCGQLLLGVEAWLARFPSPQWNQAQPLPVHPELFRSLHYFVGALLFAVTLMVTLQAYRRTLPAAQVQTAPVGTLEGAV
jgi:cytochrome c oxidase assembly protein subunit 15